MLPLLTILLPPVDLRVPITFIVVVLALALTGFVSAKTGGNPAARPTERVVVGGALALSATFALGSLLRTTGNA
ncbi:VIT family protein [Microbacterium oxydans]|uniref:VIT family protein n=1 Tax=Microbacterium oxydans TaxID=82380 RepID=A0A0F0KBR5_9MICO|nr:VIT family protein [Microbacterium oxydans]